MLYFDGAFGLALLILWVFCVIDVITTPEYECRNLPKLLWVVLVLLLPDVGSIAWLIAGRPRASAQRPGGLPYKGNVGERFAEYDRPGRQTATNPDDDEAFLRRLRERAEEQRRRAREQKKDRDADES